VQTDTSLEERRLTHPAPWVSSCRRSRRSPNFVQPPGHFLMTSVTRRERVLPRRNRVRISNPTIGAVDDDLAATSTGNYAFGPSLCLGLGIVVRTSATRVRFLDVPSAPGTRYYVAFVSPRHDVNPLPGLSVRTCYLMRQVSDNLIA